MEPITHEYAEVFDCYCLVDITASGITKLYNPENGCVITDTGDILSTAAKWNLARAQQRNYDVVLQTLMLRTTPAKVSKPTVITGPAPDFMFGTNYTGTLRVWHFYMCMDRECTIASSDNPAGLALDDINLLPVSVNLTESIKIDPPVIVTTGLATNFYITKRINT